MRTNVAQQRAQKAIRRKAVLAERRKSESLETTLAARIRRAANAPIQHCLVPSTLFDVGIGTVIMARGLSPRRVAVAVFLVDVFCLGIKDVFFRDTAAEDLEMFLDMSGSAGPLLPADPANVRKLLRDVAGWSASIGFEPHADFAVVERVFGVVHADSSDAVFQFGSEGKPMYVPGPHESPALVRRRLEQLERRLGLDGFHYLIATDMADDLLLPAFDDGDDDQV